MCQTSLLVSTTCTHAWMALAHPCAPGNHLGNCPIINSHGVMGRGPPRPNRVGKSCPECDRDNDYDGDYLRMIDSVRFLDAGSHYGAPPRKEAEVVCCGVM